MQAYARIRAGRAFFSITYFRPLAVSRGAKYEQLLLVKRADMPLSLSPFYRGHHFYRAVAPLRGFSAPQSPIVARFSRAITPRPRATTRVYSHTSRLSRLRGSLGTYQASLRLDEGSILAVHLVVKATGVAEVVTGAVPSPEGCRCGAAIHALATLYRDSHPNGTKIILIRRQSSPGYASATLASARAARRDRVSPFLSREPEATRVGPVGEEEVHLRPDGRNFEKRSEIKAIAPRIAL